MATLFKQQGVLYKKQGDYRVPCVTLPNEEGYEIGRQSKMSASLTAFYLN